MEKQPNTVEHENESSAGLVKGVERIWSATRDAANNPEAIRKVLGLLEAGRTAGVSDLAVYNAIFKVCFLHPFYFFCSFKIVAVVLVSSEWCRF